MTAMPAPRGRRIVLAAGILALVALVVAGCATAPSDAALPCGGVSYSIVSKVETSKGWIAAPGEAFIDGRDLQASAPLTVIKVNVWDSPRRQHVVCWLRHGAHVLVSETVWIAAESRSYFKVLAGGCTGWLPEAFLSERSEPAVGDLIE